MYPSPNDQREEQWVLVSIVDSGHIASNVSMDTFQLNDF